MKQKTVKLVIRIVAGIMALLMISSLFLMTGCSSQKATSDSTSINPLDYAPAWDDSKLTERDLTFQVGEDESGDYYMVTVDWQNPDAKPAVTVSAPDETSYDPHTTSGASATFAIPDFKPGTYTVHISGYGLGQISIMSYPYTGQIQDLEKLEAEANTESEIMTKIKDLFQSSVSTDLQTKLNLISATQTAESDIPFGYPVGSEGYYCFNPDEAFAFMIIDAKSPEQADSIAMSAMDNVQKEMATDPSVKYTTQCWAVGNFAALLLTPTDFDFESLYSAMNQLMVDNSETNESEVAETTESEAATTESESTAESTPAESESTASSEDVSSSEPETVN